MLVDNPVQHQPYFSTGASYSDFSTDLNDIFHAELFSNAANNSNSPATASTSSGSSSPRSPFHTLLTPPLSSHPSSFPEIQDLSTTPNNFFNFLDEDLKVMDPLPMPSSAPYDFIGAFGNGMDMGMSGMNMDMGMSLPSTESSSSSPSTSSQLMMGIDPQLVGTPDTSRAMSDFDDEEGEADNEESPSNSEPKEKEKLTLTIAPVKVGGHGKARKGTVQSGGVVKKVGGGAAVKDKENTSAAVPKGPKVIAKTSSGDAEDEDDDLPGDWRPSPEVFQKMTSKEKRQLRNKISARNFRVRRKEYISTLEGDIAERDRILDAIRSELGSTQSENIALRQEIATLKKTLLEGRGVDEAPVLNLPPPAPLPTHSAAATLAAPTSTPPPAAASSSLVTANTHKDLPHSHSGRGFWGGVGMGIGAGGVTPVHTALMPELLLSATKGVGSLQENINPALNVGAGAGTGAPAKQVPGGFDGFADLNPFTMKTLDAYRMQLWGKMAAQHHAHTHQQQQNQNQNSAQQQSHLSGLATGLRPQYFTPSTKHNILPTPGGTLSALLSGKHGAYMSPPALFGKKEAREKERGEREQREAMYAVIASQTLLKRLGSAFWDAFSGGSPGGVGGGKGWDADKVRRVLEGKAVVKVVDVDGVHGERRAGAHVQAQTQTQSPSQCGERKGTGRRGGGEGERCCVMTDLLEESMRSLSLGKKA